MPPPKPTDDTARESLAKACDTIAKLRYLCTRYLPELQPPALLPRETQYDRLDYLLSRIDGHEAMRAEHEARNRAR